MYCRLSAGKFKCAELQSRRNHRAGVTYIQESELLQRTKEAGLVLTNGGSYVRTRDGIVSGLASFTAHAFAFDHDHDHAPFICVYALVTLLALYLLP
jgi:hypothetical protein